MGSRRTKGFTLLELMMTLSVIGVILAIATPSFREFRLNNRMTGTANDLLTSVQLARSEAIKRQQPIAVCPSQNPGATPPVCRAGPIWSDTATPAGLVLWVDTDNDATPDAGEVVVAPRERMDPALTVRSNFNVVSYQPSGFAEIAGNPPVRAVLICDERSNQIAGDSYRKRLITVDRTGRPSSVKLIAAVDELENLAFGATSNCP